MFASQSFVVEGQLLGVAERLPMKGVRGIEPPSFAFFCYQCGETWAKCPVTINRTGKTTSFLVWTVSCRTCNDTSRYSGTPGTLHLPLQPEFNASFPDDVVRWEFDRNLESLSHIEGIIE